MGKTSYGEVIVRISYQVNGVRSYVGHPISSLNGLISQKLL